MKIESTFHVYSGAQGLQKTGLKFLVLGQTGMFGDTSGLVLPARVVGFPPVWRHPGRVAGLVWHPAGCCGRKWWGASDTGDGHFLPCSAAMAFEVFGWEFRLLKGCLRVKRKRFSFWVLKIRRSERTWFWDLPLLFDVSPKRGGESEGTRAFLSHLLSWFALTSWVVCLPSKILASKGFVRTSALML